MTDVFNKGSLKGARKLVYVLNHFSLDGASHFAHVIGLVEALAARGVQVLLVIEKAFDMPSVSADGIKVVGIMEPNDVKRFFRLALTLRAAARDGYTAIFVRIGMPAALTAVLACLGTGVRVYYWQSGTVHALDRAAATGLKRLGWLLRSCWPFRLVVKAVDRFATGPEAMVRYYRDEMCVPASKLVCLYNDINVNQYRDRLDRVDRQAERAKLGADEATSVLLFVHRLSPIRKTMMYVPPLLDALRERGHRQWILVLAGGGPEFDRVSRAITDSGLGNRCRVLGSVPARELPVLYRAADIFVNPTFTEGFPRVILEAMAAGLPIVTTDAGGTSEILGPLQQQFVIPRESSEGFAQSVADLMDRPMLQNALSEENRVTVHRFDTGRIAEMYERELFG